MFVHRLIRKLIYYCSLCTVILMAGCALWYGRGINLNEGDLIFSHKRHVEIDIQCLDCHKRISQSELASENMLPVGEPECLQNCHKRSQGCELCHTDVDRAVRIIPKEYRVLFSHKTHLELEEEQLEGEQKPDCLTCHRVMRDSASVSDDYWPELKVCRRCHDITLESCHTCHLKTEEKTFVPISHDTVWLSRHKQESALEDQLCDNCHRGEIRPTVQAAVRRSRKSEGKPTLLASSEKTKGHTNSVPQVSETATVRYCADCHRGDLWPEEVHDNNYLQSHRTDAKAGSGTCISCHQREECLSCHERNGISFAAVHTAGWPFNHADKARRQLSACTTCHGEEDCLGCHQAISPHPKGWDRDITKQNEKVCQKCHIN